MALYFLMILFVFLLTRSRLAVQYAQEGLLLWFQHMIPALFPCIVWSNIMLETDSAPRITRWIQPFLRRFLGLSGHGSFVFLAGFTGGFPLGAKLSADLYRKENISLKEAEFLLSFSNNLGPVYLFGFLFPAIGVSHKFLCLAILYGIPIAYGFVRYRLVYRAAPFDDVSRTMHGTKYAENLASALDDSLQNGVNSIVMLGAYVIFFQTFRLFYTWLPHALQSLAVLCTEINSGIRCLTENGITPDGQLMILGGITFGGLSCFTQTAHVLKDTELSAGRYIRHKLIQTALVVSAFFFCSHVLHIAL